MLVVDIRQIEIIVYFPVTAQGIEVVEQEVVGAVMENPSCPAFINDPVGVGTYGANADDLLIGSQVFEQFAR